MLLEVPYPSQLADKAAHCASLLGPAIEWSAPVSSPQFGFRNKAKMVVGGTVDAPTLGILGPDGGVDLRDCLLHEDSIQAALPTLASFVSYASLTPYDVRKRTGELKHLLVTASPDGELMVRFVLRSQEAIARIRKHLPTLQAALPSLVVASANIQPIHQAIIEGDLEIPLTDEQSMQMRLAGHSLWLRPQSFFQTNTAIAEALYQRARTWIDESARGSVWDLYCGVGGFALQAASAGRPTVGVEVSQGAVSAASRSADEAGVPATFEAADAIEWAAAQDTAADLVIVNPPRRGLGPELSTWLESSTASTVLYSSCNAETLAADLARMPSLRAERAVVFDMFPNTDHYEVLTLLRRA